MRKLKHLEYVTVEYNPADRRGPAVPANGTDAFNWRGLVLDCWAQPDGTALHGKLPEGLAVHQFYSKVSRAAKRMRGEVGVAVRDGEWWCWPRRRPAATTKEQV